MSSPTPHAHHDEFPHQHTTPRGQLPDSDHDADSLDSPREITLYTPSSPLIFLRATAINLLLPFINGLMLGFGELFAHEIAFRWGWGGTRVFPPGRRAAGPGVEVRETRRRDYLEDIASMQE